MKIISQEEYQSRRNNLLDKIKNVNINKGPRSKLKPSDHTPIEIKIN